MRFPLQVAVMHICGKSSCSGIYYIFPIGHSTSPYSKFWRFGGTCSRVC